LAKSAFNSVLVYG